MPKSHTPAPSVREIEEFWRDGQDARASGDSATQRERLLIELVYAARSLATHAIRRRHQSDATGIAADRFVYDCRECRIISTGPGLLTHKPSCRVGRVLAAIDEIQALFPAEAPAKGAESQGGAR